MAERLVAWKVAVRAGMLAAHLVGRSVGLLVVLRVAMLAAS